MTLTMRSAALWPAWRRFKDAERTSWAAYVERSTGAFWTMQQALSEAAGVERLCRAESEDWLAEQRHRWHKLGTASGAEAAAQGIYPPETAADMCAARLASLAEQRQRAETWARRTYDATVAMLADEYRQAGELAYRRWLATVDRQEVTLYA